MNATLGSMPFAGMKTFAIGAAVLLGVFALRAESGPIGSAASLPTPCGDVWGEAKYAWTFDKDVNGDGILQTSEVRDMRYWGSTNVNGAAEGCILPNAISNDGEAHGPWWVSGSVSAPARGVTMPATQYLHLNCTTNWVDGICKGTANGFTFPSGTSVSGSVSVVVRLRVDRFGSCRFKTAYFLNNGLNWDGMSGTMFGFSATDTTFTNAYPYVLIGQKSAGAGADYIRMTTNVWYDVGYSVTDKGNGRAEVLFMVSGVSSDSQKRWYDTLRTKTVQVAAGAFTNETTIGARVSVGAEQIGKYGENGTKGVVGDIHRIAIWSRALSAEELAEALGRPATYFQAGFEDGRNGEFGLVEETDAEASFAPDESPCREMPRALTASRPSLKLAYTPRTDESRNMGGLFRVKLTPTSEAQTTLELTVGGKSLGRQVVAAGAAADWFVRRKTLVAGSNAFVLTRCNPEAGTCEIDALQMTGSWQLGVEDSSHSGFSAESYVGKTAYLMNWNTTGLPRAMFGKSMTDANAGLRLWFKAPNWIGDHYNFRLTGRVISQGCGNDADRYKLTNTVDGCGWTNNQWPFAVDVNGRQAYATPGVPNGTSYSFVIPSGTLSNGWNVINTHINANAPASYWLMYDFHRLELLPTTGMVLIFR